MAGDTKIRELAEVLHWRLVSGEDYRITAEMAELFLPLLIERLKRSFAGLRDPHVVESAAIDSMLAYFKEPQRFQPQKGSLLHYLYMDARFNIIDALRPRATVELPMSQLEYILEGISDVDDAELGLVERESPLLRQALALVQNPVDQEIVTLMIEGVRDTAIYASVLGVDHRPKTEQAALVKRNKDRLKKLLQRGIVR